MEILPGVHQIPLVYKNRPLKLYLLQFGGESMLMDTGFADNPARDILPYFQSIGFDPGTLTYILLTHPDIDHIGGAYAMRTAAPQARFLCGALDRPQIETPEALGHLRARAHYHWHGLGPDDARLAAFIQNAGGAGNKLTFARTFSGRESLSLGGTALEVLHLPGHSLGHLGVYLPHARTAIVADAVHGTANRFLDGKAAFACTYMYIDAYLGTIAQLGGMALERLYSCHWPDCATPSAVQAFLAESRAYALRAEQAILDTVRAAGAAGLTLQEVCIQAKSALGDWPADRDLDTRYMACGHLQRLTEIGEVRITEDRPTRYVAQNPWLGLR